MGNKQCPLPYIQLYLHSSGRVYPCGFLQNNVLVGDLKKSTLKEIWNSIEMKTFRDSHERGLNIECEKQQGKYNCNILHPDMEVFEKTTLELRRLDFMIDSFCNLKCTMCTNIYEEAGGFENQAFWDELEKDILPYLNQIEIIGGEPFILKDTFRLISLGAQVNPKLKWWFTTNGHFDWGKTIPYHLGKIVIDSMAVSIDSLNESKFKQIRQGGELKRVLENLDNFIEFKSLQANKGNDFHLVVNFVIQKINARELPEMLHFARSKQVSLYPILLREPAIYSILNGDKNELLGLFDYYIDANFKLLDYKLMNIILKITKYIDKVSLMHRIEIINSLQGKLQK